MLSNAFNNKDLSQAGNIKIKKRGDLRPLPKNKHKGVYEKNLRLESTL